MGLEFKHLAKELGAVQFWHPYVRDYDRTFLICYQLKGLGSLGRSKDLAANLAKLALESVYDILIVI